MVSWKANSNVECSWNLIPSLGPSGLVMCCRWVNLTYVMWETYKSWYTEIVFRGVLTFYECNYFMNDYNILSLRVIFHSELWCSTALIFSWIFQSPASSRAGRVANLMVRLRVVSWTSAHREIWYQVEVIFGTPICIFSSPPHSLAFAKWMDLLYGKCVLDHWQLKGHQEPKEMFLPDFHCRFFLCI